jgi:hypothetical protein
MSSESFKRFDAITDPDSRSTGWVRMGHDGTETRFDLVEHHRFLQSIVLDPLVPENLRDQFMTAKHLALYAWFVYRFHMTSSLQALTTLEYALRERLVHTLPTTAGKGKNNSKSPMRPNLRGLLMQAIESGLVESLTIPGRLLPPESGDFDRESPEEWLRRLPALLADQRNRLAHGTFELMPSSGWTLLVVADIINQLYRIESTPST